MNINCLGPFSGEEDLEETCRALMAMCHPARLQIVCLLRGGELHVGKIAERLGISQSGTSHHLAILRDKHVLACRKDEGHSFYRVRDPRTFRLIDLVHSVLSERGSFTDERVTELERLPLSVAHGA